MLAIPVGLALLAFAVGCAVNPATGKRELSLVSSDQELRMGQEAYASVINEYGLYEDPALAAMVDSVGQAVARVSHLPNLKWTFTLLDDDVVNAFAMPGGYIYITRGILAHLNSEAQLAGVLGHEVGHVTARHSAKQMTQQQLAGVGFGVASLYSKTFRQYGEAAQQAMQLMFLKYGRDDETQADQLGVDYSVAGNYDAREMPATYRILARVSAKAGQRLPEYLSTHPDPGNREVRTGELAATATRGKSGLQIRARSYVQRLDGVIFGRDPRDGYFEGSHYYNPRLRFDIALPEGWVSSDSKQSLVSMEPNKGAQMQMAMIKAQASSPQEFVSKLLSAGTIAAADGQAMTLGGLPAWSGRIRVPKEDGSVSSLVATWIQRDAEGVYQLIGQSAQPGDANEARMLTAMRSFHALTDAAKLNVKPWRVRVVPAKSAGTLAAALTSNGVPDAFAQDVAIMNDRELDQSVQTGELIKIIAR